MITHYTNDSSSGEWLRAMIEMAQDSEIAIDVDPNDGMWVVGGMVKVDTFESAMELARAA